jgi:hypothetical protein
VEKFRGVVVYWNKEKWFGLVRVFDDASETSATRDKSETFLAHGANIVPDEYGSRYVRVGEHVEWVEETEPRTYVKKPDHTNGLPMRVGKDVKAYERPARPEGYTEDCVVSIVKTRWNTEPVCGFAKRPEGDTIFWHKNDITTEGVMEIGTKFNCVPERNREGSSCWRASRIEIYMPAQSNEGEHEDGHEQH